MSVCHKCKKESKILMKVGGSIKKPTMMCTACNTSRIRGYRKNPKYRESANKASRKAYRKHKVKWLARLKARYAVSKGIIIKPKKCEVCNLVKILQGHHEDYSKPLEVIWLCWTCHAQADKELEQKNIK